jgi:serine/threonine protein kinase
MPWMYAVSCVLIIATKRKLTTLPQEFIPEISIMKSLNHPNIVKFHGAWMKKRELFVSDHLLLLCLEETSSFLSILTRLFLSRSVR